MTQMLEHFLLLLALWLWAEHANGQVLCMELGFFNVLNTHAHSSMKYEDETGKIMELQENGDAKIVWQNVSSVPITGSFEFLSSDTEVGNGNLLNYITLLVVYNSKTGLPLGHCKAKRGGSFVDQENHKWRHIKWIVERNLLFCHVYGEESTTVDFNGFNDTSISLQFGDGQSNICIKNLTIPQVLGSSSCPPDAPLQSIGIDCGCSLLTPSIYSTRYDLPLLNDDALKLDENFEASTMNRHEANPQFSFVNSSSPLPDPIAFPLFRPITPNSSESDNFKSVKTDIPIDSAKNEEALLEHLKISPISNSKLGENSNSKTSDFNIDRPANTLQFTPAPEIWIRATRPLFRHNVAARNSTKPATEAFNPAVFPSSVRSNIQTTSTPASVFSNVFSVATESPLPSIDSTESLQCVPKCEKEGICVAQGNGINVCKCPDGLLGRNCNIQNPCVNVTTCSEYGPQARCITDIESMSAKAPLQFVEAPHLCLCQDDNSEWTECSELESMEVHHNETVEKTDELTTAKSESLTIENFGNGTVTPINFAPESTPSSILDLDHSAFPKIIASTGIRVHKLLHGGTNESLEKSGSLELSEKLTSSVPQFPIHEQFNSSSFKKPLPTETSSGTNASSSSSSSSSVSKSESTEGTAFGTGSFHPHFPMANVSLNIHPSESVDNENNFELSKSASTEEQNRGSNPTFTLLPEPSFEKTDSHLAETSPELKFSTNSFTVVPENQGNNDISSTVIRLSTPPSFTLFKTEKTTSSVTVEPTSTLSSTTSNNAPPVPTIQPVETELENVEKETSRPFEAEGDNGFEQMTQHIFGSDLDLTTPKSNSIESVNNPDLNGDSHAFSANEHGAAFESSDKHTELFTAPATTNEELPDDSNFIHVTPLTSTVVLNLNSKLNNNHKPANGFDEKLSPTMQGKEKHNPVPHENRFGSSSTSFENRGTANSDSAYSSRFGSDLVSWIIAFGVLGFFLLTVASGTICVGRYVRRSRRLHGKYNPAREETAVASTYSMPMTTVSKEERLI